MLSRLVQLEEFCRLRRDLSLSLWPTTLRRFLCYEIEHQHKQLHEGRRLISSHMEDSIPRLRIRSWRTVALSYDLQPTRTTS